MSAADVRAPWVACYVGSGDWDLTGPETQQDWVLAAAAPELLAALQDALTWFEQDCPLGEPCGPEMRKARAAIAKATGAA